MKEWQRQQELTVNEWFEDGQCWFKGETITEVEDEAGSSYPTEPYGLPVIGGSGFFDSCVFKAPRDTFEPLNMRDGILSYQAVFGNDYLFPVVRVERGGSGNLPDGGYEEWRIAGCVWGQCSAEPTWEVYREEAVEEP